MVSFDDRSFLESQDLKLIKELGLKFRGSNAWPNFRSFEPGNVPWQLTTRDQVEYLTLVLQQATELAQRYGNGRTARLLLNFELMKSGYPPIVIEKEIRAEYYAALDEAHTTGNNDKFIQLVSNIVDQTFDLYLRLI